MADKKNQHYVPRFYLKNFSPCKEKKSINLYNLRLKEAKSNVSLKDQCSKPYFYGKDLRIENGFQDLEGITSVVVKNILTSHSVPRKKSTDYGTLCVYTLMQYARTLRAATDTNEIVDMYVKDELVRSGRFSEEELRALSVGIKDPIRMALTGAARSYNYLFDLNVKVLRNCTSIEFITSDNPVIFYNQYFEKSKALHLSNVGITTKGLQIFLPLSNNYLLVFYDEKTYKIGDRKKAVCQVTNPNDVRQLNDLQYLNCSDNLYSFSELSSSDIFSLEHRNFERKRIRNAEFHDKNGTMDDGTPARMRYVVKQDYRIGLSLESIRPIQTASLDELNRSPRPVRTPELVRTMKRFQAQVDAGKYLQTQFKEFLEDEMNT